MILQQLMILHHGKARNLESGVTRQFILMITSAAPTSGSPSSGRSLMIETSQVQFFITKSSSSSSSSCCCSCWYSRSCFSCRLLAGQPTKKILPVDLLRRPRTAYSSSSRTHLQKILPVVTHPNSHSLMTRLNSTQTCKNQKRNPSSSLHRCQSATLHTINSH